MGPYIKTYMKNVDNAIADEGTDFEALKREQLVQIGFVQHERFVHLLVTVMVCILLFIGMCVFFLSQMKAFLIVDGLLLILSLCYLLYYFFIENATQRMYRQYDLISRKTEPDNATVDSIYNNIPD